MAQIRKPKRPNPQELARREDIFRVYRDLGPARSYNRLIVAIRDRFGEVNKRQLMTWSKEYSWQERLHVHDAEEEKRRALAERDELDPNFDQQDALLRAAAKALKRALEATVTVAIKAWRAESVSRYRNQCDQAGRDAAIGRCRQKGRWCRKQADVRGARRARGAVARSAGDRCHAGRDRAGGDSSHCRGGNLDARDDRAGEVGCPEVTSEGRWNDDGRTACSTGI
jgi:hypothetical protein